MQAASPCVTEMQRRRRRAGTSRAHLISGRTISPPEPPVVTRRDGRQGSAPRGAQPGDASPGRAVAPRLGRAADSIPMGLRWTTVFLDLPAAGFERPWTSGPRSPAPVRHRGATRRVASRLRRPPSGTPACGCNGCVPGTVAATWTSTSTATTLPAKHARLARGLGAGSRDTEPGSAVLSSPGGFGFCIVPHEGEARLPPAVPIGPGGPPAGRLDQLCLDIPEPLFDAEYAFRAALTGWPPRGSTYPEFEGVRYPAGTPVHLLFQRRASREPGDLVTAHVDFACGPDTVAVAQHHVALGAVVDADHGQWIRMRDPRGRPYCLTRRAVAADA